MSDSEIKIDDDAYGTICQHLGVEIDDPTADDLDKIVSESVRLFCDTDTAKVFDISDITFGNFSKLTQEDIAEIDSLYTSHGGELRKNWVKSYLTDYICPNHETFMESFVGMDPELLSNLKVTMKAGLAKSANNKVCRAFTGVANPTVEDLERTVLHYINKINAYCENIDSVEIVDSGCKDDISSLINCCIGWKKVDGKWVITPNTYIVYCFGGDKDQAEEFLKCLIKYYNVLKDIMDDTFLHRIFFCIYNICGFKSADVSPEKNWEIYWYLRCKPEIVSLLFDIFHASIRCRNPDAASEVDQEYIESLCSQVTQCNLEIARLNAKSSVNLTQYNTMVNNYELQIEELNIEINNGVSEEVLIGLNEQISDLTSQLLTCRDDYNQLEIRFNRVRSRLKNEVSSLTESLEGCQDALGLKQDELTQCQLLVTNLEAEVLQLTNTLASCMEGDDVNILANLQSTIADLQSQLSALTIINDQKCQLILTLTSEKEDLQEEVTECREELSDAVTALKDCNDINSILECELRKCQADRDEAEALAAKYKACIDAYKAPCRCKGEIYGGPGLVNRFFRGTFKDLNDVRKLVTRPITRFFHTVIIYLDETEMESRYHCKRIIDDSS